ncbi:MAG: alpha/beta hydrolase [Thermoanaerobaculia bacterium]
MSARVLAAGTPLGQATAAMILVHGRGASAEDILSLGRELGRPDLAYLAPQAEGYSWYPYSFMAPLERNEPGLSNGLALIGHLVERLGSEGIPPERTVLLGFSQGACLTLEYAARNARRFGGVAGLSGGLIGPPGTPRDYPGTFDGTPVFLGCSDRDPHIPLERVKETTAALTRMGAQVTERIYPAMGHTVNEDELERVRGLLAGL